MKYSHRVKLTVSLRVDKITLGRFGSHFFHFTHESLTLPLASCFWLLHDRETSTGSTMSRTLRLSLFILPVLISFVAIAQQNELAPDPALEEVRAEIEVENARWIHAFRTQNAEKAADLFDAEGAMLGPEGTITYGPANILEGMKRWMEQLGSARVQFEQHDLWRIENIAYETGRFTYIWNDQTNGEEERSSGVYTTIWKQQSDGSWKIFRSIPLPE